MNLYQRYINGETKTVYDDIHKLGVAAFHDIHKKDIENVLKETFERVSFNLQIIHKELINIGYQFKTVHQFNFEKPFHQPLINTNTLIEELDAAVGRFGSVPLSLKYFYQIVGGVNFVWDYETNHRIKWEMADPIQVASLDSLVSEVNNEDWAEYIQQYVDDENFGSAFLNLSADDYHKDNISGGEAYSIEITKQQSIDSNFLNEANKTTFINYLRISFESCGFPGIAKPYSDDDFIKFYETVKPQLKEI